MHFSMRLVLVSLLVLLSALPSSGAEAPTAGASLRRKTGGKTQEGAQDGKTRGTVRKNAPHRAGTKAVPERKTLFRRKEKSIASVLFPGVAPEEYDGDQEITSFVELVDSKKTQVPFKFYDLPVCQGPPVGKKTRKNLGAKLQGYNSFPSPYNMKVLKNQGCTPVCVVKIAPKKVQWMRKLIILRYRAQMVLDQLPVVVRSSDKKFPVKGYPVGFYDQDSSSLDKAETFINNHLKFIVFYHKDDAVFDGVRIVGFEVRPLSIDHKFDKKKMLSGNLKLDTCQPGYSVHNKQSNLLALTDKDTPMDIMYSYEIEWIESAQVWADRWDTYLDGRMEDDVHMLSIVNSLMIVLFLGGTIATVLVRFLRKDIDFYNDLTEEDESGWKLLHGDIFRPPSIYPMFLSVAVGTGTQIFCTIFLTFTFMFTISNPMNKGQTLTTIVMMYVLTGTISGYVSSRLYKFFDEKKWKQNTLLTAVAFPGLLVFMFIFLNIFLAFAGAATAVSFLTIISIFSLWICVSTPLVFIGSYWGFRKEVIQVPTKTNQISRFIPPTPWHVSFPSSVIISGILPFASICIELYFILGAIWLRHIYYLIGFLFAVVIIVTISCSEICVILHYLQISSEDHRWWWKSFFNGAAVGGYCFLYALWFLSSMLDLVGTLPIMIYLIYTSMLCIAMSLLGGSIGVLTCLYFNLKIYAAVKVD